MKTLLLTFALAASCSAEVAYGQQIVRLDIPAPEPTGAMLDAYREGSEPSLALLTEIVVNRVSLFPPTEPPDLNVSIRDGKIIYSTTASYYTETPRCAGGPLDFQIAATANFGLRGYVFDWLRCTVFETGQYDTAYYSVDADEDHGLLAFAIPGKGRIDLHDLATHKLVESISGYSATTVTFHNGLLYFGGYPEGGAWDRASVYAYSPNSGEVIAEYMSEELADVRGIAFQQDAVAVSDGAHDRIIVAEKEGFRPRTIIEGLNYPNGVSFAQNGDLLAADEHNGLVHRLSPTWEIVWSSPRFELISPGSVTEIARGRLRGHLLIADADGNRVIVVHPCTWTIAFEVSGLRSTLKALPLYSAEPFPAVETTPESALQADIANPACPN